MPTFGGFYVCPTAWREWVHAQGPPTDLPWGSLYAEAQINLMLRRKKLDKLFRTSAVPIPETEKQEGVYALVVYTRYSPTSRRVYFPPRPNVKADRDGRDILQKGLGLTTTEYRTVWYDEYSTGDEDGAEFLNDPRPMAVTNGYRKWLLLLVFGAVFTFWFIH